MSHIKGVTTVIRGKVRNIPSPGLKDPAKNERAAVRTENARLKAGGRARENFGTPSPANFAKGVRASKARSAAAGRKGSESQAKRTVSGKRRFSGKKR